MPDDTQDTERSSDYYVKDGNVLMNEKEISISELSHPDGEWIHRRRIIKNTPKNLHNQLQLNIVKHTYA